MSTDLIAKLDAARQRVIDAEAAGDPGQSGLAMRDLVRDDYRRALVAAYPELRALIVGDPWQPIATAPKDDKGATDGMVWLSDGRRVASAWWSAPFPELVNAAAGGQWVVAHDREEGDIALDFEPTHWKPYRDPTPAPP